VLPNLTVKNLAVSGTTSLEHVEILRDRLDPREQDTFGLVVVTTGGNDLIHRHYWYATNLEDPNDRGYDAIRRLFLIEMAKEAGSLR
jgi:hypothetical protein